MTDFSSTLSVSLPALSILGPALTCNQPDVTRLGNGFHTRFADDLALLSEHGVTDVRLGFDWARLQLRTGGLNNEWAQWYSDVITAAERNNIRLWATLLERTLPQWFDDENGFSDTKFAGKHWPRYVEMLADAFGDRVAGWFPIDDPIGFAARNETDDGQRHGELVNTLVVAWRDAWRVLQGGPPVAGSFGVRMVRPVDQTVDAAERARREDHLRWKTFLRGTRDGTVVIPGRADRTLPDLAGAIDIVGIKLRSDLGTDLAIDDDSLRRWQERATMLIHRLADEGPDKPIAITYRVARRNTAETQSDAEVLSEAFLRAVASCKDDGLPIQHVFTEPGIAAHKTAEPTGLLDWDRNLTLSGASWKRSVTRSTNA